MTQRPSLRARVAQRATALLGSLSVLALSLCGSACATQGDDTEGRPAQLPGAGSAGGAGMTAEAGSGGAAGATSVGSGGARPAADGDAGGTVGRDAAMRPPTDLPPECTFDDSELDEPMDPAAEIGSASNRAAGCLIGTLVDVCTSATGFHHFCPEASLRDVVRCARSVLQFSPEMCSYTALGSRPECAGAVNFCEPTGCVSSACPQTPPVPLPFTLSPCCTLRGECGFIGPGAAGRPECLPDSRFPWHDAGAN